MTSEPLLPKKRIIAGIKHEIDGHNKRNSGADTFISNDIKLAPTNEALIDISIASKLTLPLKEMGNKLLSRSHTYAQDMIGWRYHEASAFASVDPEGIVISDQIYDWAHSVANHLVYKNRYKFKNDKDEACRHLYNRFLAPFCNQILGDESNCLKLLWSEVPALLFDKILIVPLIESNALEIILDSDYTYRVQYNCFISCFEQIEDYIGGEYFRSANHRWISQAPERLDDYNGNLTSNDLYIADITEMWTILVRGFSPEKHIYELPDGSGFLGISLHYSHDICSIHIGNTKRDALECALGRASQVLFSIRSNGAITHGSSAWNHVETHCEYAIKWILGKVYSSLLDDYIQALDGFKKIRECKINDEQYFALSWQNYTYNHEYDDDAEAVCLDNQPRVEKKYVGRMRRRQFFKICERLGLKVESGKGSELKVYRPGQPIYTIGCHGVGNSVVPSWLAIKVLQRAGITLAEWFDVIESP